MKFLVTGNQGFIGSNLTRYLLDRDHEVIGFDKHGYASRSGWARRHTRATRLLRQLRADVTSTKDVEAALRMHAPDAIIHLAAESHVCNSITDPTAFLFNNTIGTFTLLDVLRTRGFQGRVVCVSTDEVFGDLPLNDPAAQFHEGLPLRPTSPYAASKASADLWAGAFVHTYGLRVITTNCSNNYGPNQHHEKLIPAAIKAILEGRPLRLYAPGTQRRDWIHVEDHCEGLLAVATQKGLSPGSRICFGGGHELKNHAVLDTVRQCMASLKGTDPCHPIELIDGRPTDDLRYSVDFSRARNLLGWKPRPDFSLRETVKWYLDFGFEDAPYV